MATSSSNNAGGGSSWSAATNWTVASGSLGNSIAFESSDSPSASETVDAKGKSHLILKPPSPDCAPCEIKISFAQEHEVRQVYVRSTARVYEIYFAPSLWSTNEYLCTVRCGIAARDDEVLHTIDSNELAGAHSMGYAGDKIEEVVSDDGNLASNSDDWVEVKVPDSLLQDNQHNAMPGKVDASPETSIQDFYEATAEITDADGCISLTLRLLSLQSRGCLYVDEIYLFADLVESADSETQFTNSAGRSSLMAMLVPTLLQLSRNGNDQRHDKHASATSEKREYLEVESGATDSTNVVNEIQQEESISAPQDVELQEMNEETPEICQVQIPAQVSDREQRYNFVAKTDVPHDNIERALEQLVSRVSKIEDICLRFEENMLKPISSMEARLQRVEQQVEMLTKNSRYSGLPSCTRFSAPSFSCNGSNSSSFYNEGNDCPACGALELEKKAIFAGKLSNQTNDMPISAKGTQFLPSLVATAPEYSCGDDEEKRALSGGKLFNLTNDMPISANGTQFLPSLVVTAPEFSCGDDEENTDALEQPDDCPREKQKQALSIDDALAAALAGFLSTTSVQPSLYSRPPTLNASESTIEENGNAGEVASPCAQRDKNMVVTIFSCEAYGTDCVNDSVLTSSCTSSMLGTGQMMGNFGDDWFREPSEGVDMSAQTNDCHIVESTWIGEASNGIDFPVSEITDILGESVGNQTEYTSDALQDGAAASAENVKGGSEKDILQVVFKSSSAPCAVDFELPILDVKFACETSSANSPLEVLLTDLPKVDVKAPLVKQSDNRVIGEQENSIVGDDGVSNCPPIDHDLFVDWDIYDVIDSNSGMEDEAPSESCTFNEQESMQCGDYMVSQRSATKGKGKPAQRPPANFKPPNVDIMKTQWTFGNTNQFLQILSIQKEKSSLPHEFLTTNGWSTLIEAYYYATGLLHEKKQMKDRFKDLKKDWVAWNKLKHWYTELSYDAPPSGRIIADDEWWAEMIERDPRMAKFKESGLEHYELMEKVFSGKIATAKHGWNPSKYVWIPGEARRPEELKEGSGDSVHVIPTHGQPSNIHTYPSQFDPLYAIDVYEPQLAQPEFASPMFQPDIPPTPFQPAQSTRDNSAKKLSLNLDLDRVADSFNPRLKELSVKKHFHISGPVSIGEALTRLTTLPGVEPGNQLYLFGSCIFTHADTREMFFALPNDEVRLAWLLEKQKLRCGSGSGSGGSSSSSGSRGDTSCCG